MKEKLEADLSEKMYNSRKTEQEECCLIFSFEFDKSELGAECENIKNSRKSWKMNAVCWITNIKAERKEYTV